MRLAVTCSGIAALIALACPGADATDSETEPGFTSLFDGRSLDGWQRFGGRNAEVWSVEDGCIVVDGEGGGWIGTERDYADFVLRLQFRVAGPGSNSGVYLRAPADTSHISRTGMEIQILDDDHPRYANIEPWQRTGSIYHVAPADPGHLKPTGAWNDLEIRAIGPHVVIAINGETVVDDRIDRHPDLDEEHPGLARTTGRLGLQCHNGRVEFRDLRVRDLAPDRSDD